MAYHPDIQEEFIIKDLDTLKAITHPLRLQLMKTIKTPKTVKEIGTRLKLPPTKLYYHINALEKHGIIRVVETNIVSGIIEKTYLITARNYRVDEHLLSNEDVNEENLSELLDGVFSATRAELRSSFRAGLMEFQKTGNKPNKGGLTRTHLSLTEEEAIAFHKKLQVLIQEYSACSDAHEDEPETPDFGLTIAFYPIVDPSEEES